MQNTTHTADHTDLFVMDALAAYSVTGPVEGQQITYVIDLDTVQDGGGRAVTWTIDGVEGEGGAVNVHTMSMFYELVDAHYARASAGPLFPALMDVYRARYGAA